VLICHTWRPPARTIDSGRQEMRNRAGGFATSNSSGGRPCRVSPFQSPAAEAGPHLPRAVQIGALRQGFRIDPRAQVSATAGTGRQGVMDQPDVPPAPPFPGRNRRPGHSPSMQARPLTAQAPGRQHPLDAGVQTAGAQSAVVRSATAHGPNGCGGGPNRAWWWSKKASCSDRGPPSNQDGVQSPIASRRVTAGAEAASCRIENPFELGTPPAPERTGIG